VYLTIVGLNGDSGEHILDKATGGGNMFERNHNDIFTIGSTDLGNWELDLVTSN
jgi:hypothetical protein